MTGTIPVLDVTNLILVLDIMRHSIGNCHIPKRGRKGFRNYFCVDKLHSDHMLCAAATQWGLMNITGSTSQGIYYEVTDLGLRVLGMTPEAITKFHKELE